MAALENYNDFIASSSIGEQLGCFPPLAIINNAAINIGMHYLLKLMFLCSSNIYSEVELLDTVVVLVFIC